ncbi:MAG: putative metal-binding motif-containing protein [Myxococcota bacterium]
MRTSLFPLLLTMIGCDLVVETDTSGFDVSFSCDAPITLYFDADNDGYGGSTSTSDCIIPVGYVTIGGDCDDREPNSHPDADELCDDEDNDCDGTIDEDVIDAVTWYLDSDGDGYGDPDTTTTACDAPSGYVIDGTDCDDGSSVTHPGAAPRESLNPQGCYLDLDGDDYGDSSPPWGVSPGSDCADDPTAEVLAASINPSANEVVGDNLDNDCDGRELCFVDADGDGYRADAVSTVVSLIDLECSAEDGEATRSAPDGDCDDASAVTYPGAAFNDSATDCMRDADGDGYGDEAAAGAIIAGTDCLDTLSDSYPGAPEVFGDNIDNNCNGRNGGEISLRESRASIIGEAAYDYAGMGEPRGGCRR